MGWNPVKDVKKGFKKITKGVGKVFEPIVKGLDKLTNGKFSKILGNKWVQGALMAVAIVTGGIAIANGVMAAGQAGVGAAAKAFATNMTMETGKTLLSTVVTGAKEFVVGVAKGLANPLKSDAGQALTGMFDSAVGSVTGSTATGADQLAEAAAPGVSQAGKAGEAAFNLGTAPPAGGQLPIPGATPSSSGLLTPGGAPPASSFMPATGAAPAGTAGALQIPGMPASPASALDPASWAGSSGNLLETGASAMPDDLLSSLAKGAKTLGGKAADYVTSPGGLYQTGSALQGWAQGQALQERWDEMSNLEKERYNSWVNRSTPMPRLTVDSV